MLKEPIGSDLHEYIHRLRRQIVKGRDLERWYNAVVLADSGEEDLARQILDAIHKQISENTTAS